MAKNISNHAQDPIINHIATEVIDLTYPVGSLYLSANSKTLPPGQGWKLHNGQVIKWVYDSNVAGSILMAASGTGDLAVQPGVVQGSSQSTDGHALTIKEMPSHTHQYYNPHSNGGNWSGNSSGFQLGETSATGGNLAHSHKLSNLKRYGVIVWQRVS